jgi:hypothetical protein
VEENIIDVRSSIAPTAPHDPSAVKPSIDVISDVIDQSYQNLSQKEKWEKFLSQETEGQNIMKTMHQLRVPSPFKWWITPSSMAEKICALSDKTVQKSEEFCERINSSCNVCTTNTTEEKKENHFSDGKNEIPVREADDGDEDRKFKESLVSSVMEFDESDVLSCRYFDHLQILVLTNAISTHFFLSFEKPMN